VTIDMTSEQLSDTARNPTVPETGKGFGQQDAGLQLVLLVAWQEVQILEGQLAIVDRSCHESMLRPGVDRGNVPSSSATTKNRGRTVNLVDEYRGQFSWRAWPTILDALPPLEGQTVLDLGCGIGDLAAELAARGAHVIGVDLQDELLAAARVRNLPDVELRKADLRNLSGIGVRADGIWSSFAAAYMTDLAPVLAGWGERLHPDGWIALTEIDDLFGHEPLAARSRELFEAYAQDALAVGRYDFHMGRKLAGHLTRAGFEVTRAFTVPDLEFAFDGPARADVLAAWRRRFDWMSLLRGLWGAEFEPVRDDFLRALADPAHRSRSTVCCCIAVKRG
jgi:SAM-dependent methyltransferase